MAAWRRSAEKLYEDIHILAVASVTIADISVVSVAVGHQLFGGTLAACPRLAEIVDHCFEQEAFSAAHPLRQPGAPKAA